MRYKNSKTVIFAPLTMAFVMVIGIFIGSRMGRMTVFDHFMFNQPLSKFDDMLNIISSNYVDSVSTDSLVENVLPELLAQLDPHSVYIPASEAEGVNEPLEGNFDGIGIQFNVQNDTITIIGTIANGPAEKAGVRQGDKIISINDTAYLGSKITNDEVVEKFKGIKGTTVKLGVIRKNTAKKLVFKISRAKIPIYSIDSYYLIRKGFGYIKINKFARTTYNEFVKAFTKLKKEGMDSLILDLRGNTGGYLDAAVNIADEFLAENKLIVYTQGRTRPRFEYRALGNGRAEDLPITILIDSYSASASEVLAGAIQDNDRGTIVGQRSFGKGLVQDMVVFRDGSSIRLTTARYYTPTGRFIQRPYKNGKADYYDDIEKRIFNHELENKDSIKFPEKNKFRTPKGKTVYGGGGIMPDIFVPIDTSGFSMYFSKVSSKYLIYNFALEYCDNNSDKIKLFANSDQLQTYLFKQKLLAEFVKYANENGIKPDYKGIEISKKLLEAYLIAYICRYFFGQDAFFKVLEPVDNVIQRALSPGESKEQTK
jgi:carboxyl-terminal processing protease